MGSTGVFFGLNPRALIKRARWLTVAIAACGAIYLGARFDFVTLPTDGCSPVGAYQPGSRLLVDRWAPGLATGDAVFVAEVSGAVHLGLLGGSEDAGSWTLVGDVEDCPTRFPASEQPVDAAGVLGRVILNLGH